jgi:hypothetical protein
LLLLEHLVDIAILLPLLVRRTPVALVFGDIGDAPVGPRLHGEAVFPRVKGKLSCEDPSLILSSIVFSGHAYGEGAGWDVLHWDSRPAALLLGLFVIILDESFWSPLPLSFAIEGSEHRPPATRITVSVLILVVRYYLRPEFFVNVALGRRDKLIDDLCEHRMPRDHVLFFFQVEF